jgi:hypothetical protein
MLPNPRLWVRAARCSLLAVSLRAPKAKSVAKQQGHCDLGSWAALHRSHHRWLSIADDLRSVVGGAK